MKTTIEYTSSEAATGKIRAFLDSHVSGVLATADKAGNPHAAVVYYSHDGEFCLSFATSHETQKQKNLEENKQVSFVVYDEAAQTTVQIVGYTQQIDNGDEYQKVIQNMFMASSDKSNEVLPPAAKLLAGGYAAYRILPRVIKMAEYKKVNADGDDVYETLLFSER